MGNCFSRSKGRSPVPTSSKDKEGGLDRSWEGGRSGCSTLNGNSVCNSEGMLSYSGGLGGGVGTPSPSSPPPAATGHNPLLVRVGSHKSEVLASSLSGPSALRVTAKTVSDSKILALFEHYRDPAEDSILAEGIEKLCSDLSLSPDDFKVLLLAWKLDASQMCRFTKEEFVSGLKALGVDSIRGLESKLPDVATQVSTNPDVFKDLYRFTFRFGLDVMGGQRLLSTDMALVLWRLVFTVREPPILSRWLSFLESHQGQIRGIPRDTWNMFLNFSEAVGNDLSSYDDTEAWPSIFDDFVEYENDQANQNISKDKESSVIR